MTRTLDLFDLPMVNRYRSRGIFLDSALALTWGSALISARAMMNTFWPASNTLTSLAGSEQTTAQQQPPVLAQAFHYPEHQLAHLTFLAPKKQVNSTLAIQAIEHIISQAGMRGAYKLLGEVDEKSALFETLRQMQFTTFARQHIFQLTTAPQGSRRETAWKPCLSHHQKAITRLYKELVPPIVQHTAPAPTRPQGLVYQKDGALLAYAMLKYGPRGIWLQPLLHPDLDGVEERLIDLLYKIPNRIGRPIYICVRSYQDWLTPAIQRCGGDAGPRQAVMFKHLTVPHSVIAKNNLRILESRHPEISTPIAQIQKREAAPPFPQINTYQNNSVRHGKIIHD